MSSIIITGNSELTPDSDSAQIIEAFLADKDAKEPTIKAYRAALKTFATWMKGQSHAFQTIQRANIKEYKNHLAGTRSPRTASLYLSALREFYKWASAEHGAVNLMENIKGIKISDTFVREPLTDTEARQLIAKAGEQSATGSRKAQELQRRDQALITLLTVCGLRTIEAARANIEDIHRKNGRPVLYVQGKGRDEKDRFAVIPPKLWEMLAAMLDDRPTAPGADPLFISYSKRNRGGRISTRSIRGIVKEALRGIGLDAQEFSAHSLRHTAGTIAAEEAGQSAARELLRHASDSMTRRYTRRKLEAQRIQDAPEDYIAARVWG